MMGPPAPAAPAPRSSTTTVRPSRAALPAAPTRTATATSRSGTTSSCSFEQHEDGSREPLPRPSIDTGMGLERIGALLPGQARQLRH
jgi:alanyl-tRNA synthetase